VGKDCGKGHTESEEKVCHACMLKAHVTNKARMHVRSGRWCSLKCDTGRR
jgi:hypothetical protein